MPMLQKVLTQQVSSFKINDNRRINKKRDILLEIKHIMP